MSLPKANEKDMIIGNAEDHYHYPKPAIAIVDSTENYHKKTTILLWVSIQWYPLHKINTKELKHSAYEAKI